MRILFSLRNCLHGKIRFIWFISIVKEGIWNKNYLFSQIELFMFFIRLLEHVVLLKRIIYYIEI